MVSTPHILPALGMDVKRTEPIGGTSTCCIPFFALIEALIFAAAAAAAAAAFTSLPPMLSAPFDSIGTGLRLLPASPSPLAGERERRSKRDFRAGSV